MGDIVNHPVDDDGAGPGGDVRIRAATPEDVAAIVAFGQQVLPAHYTPIIGEQAARGQLDWWTDELVLAATRDGREFVAEREWDGLDGGHRVVGVCETGFLDGAYVVWKLYVHPSRRGRSLGSAMLRIAIDARPSDTEEVWLEHFAGNVDAARFYEREGFGWMREDPAPGEDPAAATVWRCRRIRG